MYTRYRANEPGGILEVYHEQGLAGLAAEGNQVRLETINGIDYYTVLYWTSSATPTKPNENYIHVVPYGPTGTILVNPDTNEVYETIPKADGFPAFRIPTTGPVQTNLNANGVEYVGRYKLAIPVDNAADSGKVDLIGSANVTVYELYIAHNETANEQSYIIADPSVGLLWTSGAFIWSADEIEEGRLQVTKTDGQGWPLPGATFELRGASGFSQSRTTGEDGIATWDSLDPGDTFTLHETEAPPGFRAPSSDGGHHQHEYHNLYDPAE
jgi:hypothetical protein